MSYLIAFIGKHATSDVLIVYYVSIAAIGSMPSPTPKSSQKYRYIFTFLNTLGGNLSRAFANKVESSPNFEEAVQHRIQQNGGS